MADQTVGNQGVLVVGASQAGDALATRLRELGVRTPVTLVGGEPHLPYHRPPLSKAFLSGKAEAESLVLRSASAYEALGIEVVVGEWVDRLEIGADGAGTAISASGREFSFGQLALTVGGAPRPLTVPGADLAGVLSLRNLADATTLRDRLAAVSNIVVIGGGFIGLEAAAVARTFGKNVVVVEALDRLMARAVAPVVSQFYLDAHRRRGVEVLLDTAVVGLSGERGHVTAVELSTGECLPADIVLVGIGLEPHLGLAEQIGLETQGGIVIDEHARTSAAGVVAAGDCTTLRLRDDAGYRRIESVANAIAQARTAAATLAGAPHPRAGVPWFWSDQDDLKLQIAGLSAGYDDVVVRGEPAAEKFSALYYREGRLLAIDCVNSPRDYMAVRKLLEKGGTVPYDLAGRVEVPLKSLLAGL
jgi:3-phenylpropionate/trans-cinnamate dioxygenase ferredoxin reductase subunit